MLRKVTYFYEDEAAPKGEIRTGLFQCWATDSRNFPGGVETFPVGLVETESGRIETPHARNVKFVDGPPSEEEAGEVNDFRKRLLFYSMECFTALDTLVELKDKRPENYDTMKPIAWNMARAVLACIRGARAKLPSAV